MPRVIVVPDAGPRSHQKYLDEQVNALHMDDEHSSLQFMERLDWAIHEAEEAEPSRLRPTRYTEVASS